MAESSDCQVKEGQIGFPLELGKACKLKGQHCCREIQKDKRMETKRALCTGILVLSAAIKKQGQDRRASGGR